MKHVKIIVTSSNAIAMLQHWN